MYCIRDPVKIQERKGGPDGDPSSRLPVPAHNTFHDYIRPKILLGHFLNARTIHSTYAILELVDLLDTLPQHVRLQQLTQLRRVGLLANLPGTNGIAL